MKKGSVRESKELKQKNRLYFSQYFLLFLVFVLYIIGSFFYFSADYYELWLQNLVGFFIIGISVILSIPLFAIGIILIIAKNRIQISTNKHRVIGWLGILFAAITVITFLLITIEHSI